MNRIPQTDPAAASGKPRQLLDGVQQKLGVVPNHIHVARTVVDFPEVRSANRPAAVQECATACGCNA